MMQSFFPHRTRRELKLKFIREENAHPDLMKTILNSHVPLGKAIRVRVLWSILMIYLCGFGRVGAV